MTTRSRSRHSRKPAARARRSSAATYRRWALGSAAALIVAAFAYGGYLAWSVGTEFESRRWDLPAQVYAAPLELYAGRALSLADLVTELKRLGYREDPRLPGPGTYRVGLGRMELATRAFDYAGEPEPARLIALGFDGDKIAAVRDARGAAVPIVRLDPLLIGSLFPAHGEDRLIVAPDEVPPLLPATLIAVEDRRFEQHHGIDLRAMVRALLVNLSAGEIRQGGSTLTQQLVRSYFLSNERTWWRKLREVFMAMALELRYDKDDLMHAYVNEVYLGQDGARSVHGFGLASQFYFGKPLAELDLHELALLVAEVRGPTYYDPYRHPDRARERRNLVLKEMADNQLIGKEAAQHAATAPLDVQPVTRNAMQTSFLGLVRRQLRADYAAADLERKGLKVYSTLDPAVQAAAERALADGIDSFGAKAKDLDGAIVVTSPQTGEVRALVGGRRLGFDGFNRALDARRPIGSLIKPAVYLAALQSGRYTLASVVDDAPIDVKLDNGDTWSPHNFDDQAHGPVPLVRALADSLNLATVRLGLDVGLQPIADVLQRLGLDERPTLYPSMLLGALTLTPIEVAQVYNTLANDGFRVPLRAVRSVAGEDGAELKRYRIEIAQAADPATVYTLDQALVQVMDRGTGKTVRAALPANLTVAGKTGTSDDLRDSWFAGFANDHLVVAWLGADDNRPIGLTGSAGAGKIWAAVMNSLEASSYEAPLPKTLAQSWIDFATGDPTAERCPDAVLLPFPAGAAPPHVFGCKREGFGLGARLKRWLKDTQ
jgi:penicillin-binding protein 1B